MQKDHMESLPLCSGGAESDKLFVLGKKRWKSSSLPRRRSGSPAEFLLDLRPDVEPHSADFSPRSAGVLAWRRSLTSGTRK